MGSAERSEVAVNTYEIEFRDGHKSTVIGETAGKAKYDYYLDIADLVDGFKDFLRHVLSCKKLRKFSVKDLFGDRGQFDHMKQSRGIEFAYQGMKVEVDGKPGTIVGGNHSMNLDVVFDGQYHKSNCHPWYETVYFDSKGNVVADYREKAGKVPEV